MSGLSHSGEANAVSAATACERHLRPGCLFPSKNKKRRRPLVIRVRPTRCPPQQLVSVTFDLAVYSQARIKSGDAQGGGGAPPRNAGPGRREGPRLGCGTAREKKGRCRQRSDQWEEGSVAWGAATQGGYVGCGSAREEEGFTANGAPEGRRRQAVFWCRETGRLYEGCGIPHGGGEGMPPVPAPQGGGGPERVCLTSRPCDPLVHGRRFPRVSRV